jgi:membrane protease YdiL (CAAX protease family)
MPVRPVAIAFLAAAVLLTGVGLYAAFLPDRSGTLAFWDLAVAPSVALALVAAPWARREELLREWLSPRWGDFSRGLAGAVVMFGAAWAFCHVVTPVGSPREIWLVTLYGQLGDPAVLHAHGGQVAGVILLAAVAEELVWRGMVTQLLADAVGTRTAWLWAAALYALAVAPTAWSLRAGNGPPDPVLVVGALGAALVWGFMARALGRLAPSILAHALFNWAVLMMFPFWGPG